MLVLYDYFRSSASFRVRIALAYKQLEYSKIAVNLRINSQNSLHFKEVNPTGLVPVLQDGSNLISQSLAIIEYLEDEYSERPLLPSGSLAKAYVRSIALYIACDIHPLNNLRIRKHLSHELQQTQQVGDEWTKHWMKLGLTNLEQQIKNSQFYTGKYCYQDQFSLADLCLIPQLFNLRRFLHERGKTESATEDYIQQLYPSLWAIDRQAQQLTAVKLAWPQE